MTHRLTIFNHKGGVGKTTLTVNVAAALAARGHVVLLVDTDPQCNLTSYLLADEVVDSLLDGSDTDDGATVWSAVRPIFNAVGPLHPVAPIELGIEGLFLLPGDIRMAQYEVFLGDAWTDCLKRRMGALRATTGIASLVQATAKQVKASFAFYDAGPNIGPLNRTLLLDSDYFAVPVACDLFSVRAISTLGTTLADWLRDWSTIAGIAPDGAPLLRGRPKLLGYIPQRFRTYGQKMARAPSRYLHHLDRRINSDVVKKLRSVDPSLAPPSGAAKRLGEVRDFGVIVQDAQSQGVPIAAVRGGDDGQKADARAAFDLIADNLISGITAWPDTGEKDSR